MTNPFIQLIELKQQEKVLAEAITAKREEALEWHFSGADTKRLTGKVAEFNGACITIKFIKNKPKPTDEINAMFQRSNEIEDALKNINNPQISQLKKEIAALTTNEESIGLKLHADQLLNAIDGVLSPQIAVTLPK